MPYKTYLRNKANAQKFRLNGIIRSSNLPGKRNLCKTFRNHRVYSAGQLPPKVDLRPYMTRVEDQSQIGSCAANTLAGAYEYLIKKAHGQDIDVSRLFIYYNARAKDQDSKKVADEGCTMTSAIEALEEFGTCLESNWQYDISRVNTRPNQSAYDEAKYHKITEALQVDINLDEMKSCLAQGFPFAFGLTLYTSFDKAGKTGVVPMPTSSDMGRTEDGNHAMLAVGYSDQSNSFIVRNSWGEQWGDKGYCYIPYKYLTDSDLCFDVWTVRKLATDDFGQEHWDNYDSVNFADVNRHGYHHHGHNHNQSDDDNRFIEGIDEDDDYDNDSNQRNDFDNSWNQRNNFDNPWNQRNDFDNPWNQTNGFDNPWNQTNGFDNSSNRNNANDNSWNQTNGFDNSSNGSNANDNSWNQRNDFDDSWNQYQMFGGNNHAKHHHQHRDRHHRHDGNGNFNYNQFRQEDNFSGFPGGYPDFDQSMNNGPNFFNNQFPPPPPPSQPAFNGFQGYGEGYGYSSPSNNFFNPYF